MPRRTYSIDTHCVVCGEVVPEDRIRAGAITCSKEHAKTRENALRAKRDLTECRYCRRPSSPEQRAAFKRFTKLENKTPHMIYPAAYEIWAADQLSQNDKLPGKTPEDALKAFAAYWNERIARDVEAAITAPEEA